MKHLLFFISLLICSTLAFGADCEFKGKSLKTGETYQPPGECSIYSCDGPGLISGKTCPEIHTLKPCPYVPTDASKPYPKCCPRHDC